jgi:hypothetical protein
MVAMRVHVQVAEASERNGQGLAQPDGGPIASPGAVVEAEEIRDCGDWPLAFGRFWARGRGSVEVEMRLAWVVRFRDGAITSFRTFTDPDEALKATGLPG